MSLIAAVPLVIVAAGAAFCCTCLPIGFVGFTLGYQGEAKPFAPEGEAAMGAAWVVGTLVGITAGTAVWIAARRPARDEPQDPI